MGCRLWGRTESDRTEATAAAATSPSEVGHNILGLHATKLRLGELVHLHNGPVK